MKTADQAIDLYNYYSALQLNPHKLHLIFLTTQFSTSSSELSVKNLRMIAK